ncbi:alpha-D-ribose 1-methylphosphonate 5-triphosphate diphosphatase [Agromyces sp. NPDC058136]|uniref:alpha-D-ribose 1-methylphosphonate 5-triphosphate diphosphatase n=1 Tax=Agromyces sp. NPDC058136 TaxID=3346354 RepID=UPI0036D9B48D
MSAGAVRAVPSAGWPAASTPEDYVLGHVRAVLPHRVLDDARIVVRNGVIEEVGPHPRGSGCDLDGRGASCVPGLVDVHSDVLARELHPRPGAAMPIGFALATAGSRLRASGVTTALHGVAFQAMSPVGLPIGSPAATEVVAALDAAPDEAAGAARDAAPGATGVLHRVDVRCPDGLAALQERIARERAAGRVPVVSHEDHTPGQGQYADPATMRRWLVTGEGMTETDAAAHVEALRRSRDERLGVRDAALARLGELAAGGDIRLFGHDPATERDIDELADRGGAVAEFPTTVEAALRARERGLDVVAGAPNALRGGSHAGNVSAAELVALGLVDALASDYLPGSQLAAAVRLARGGACTLPAAIGLVTSGPAAAIGLDDRGAIAPGLRADLVVADLDGEWPHVHAVLTAAQRRSRHGP